MLRRRMIVVAALASAASPQGTDTARGVAPLTSTSALCVRSRGVSTRGQFNPIHDFSVSFGRYSSRTAPADGTSATAPPTYAKDEKEFERLIASPGPLRVSYSTDYLEWLYLAYKNKAAYELAQHRRRAAAMAPPTAAAAGEAARAARRGPDSMAQTDGAHRDAAGRFLRPASSLRRRAGESLKAASQARVSTIMRQQGYYDLIERQPQFPFIDLSNASRVHYVELFKDMVLHYHNTNCFSLGSEAGGHGGFAQELWDKALLYRAILQERRLAYPEHKGFAVALDAVDETNLSQATAPGGGPPDPLARRCPSQAHASYFTYLVKKYLVDNAVEGHVVLKLHRIPQASELLFSSPPPRDDNEVFAAMSDKKLSARSADAGGGSDAGAAASSPAPPTDLRRSVELGMRAAYPPLEALWRCEENLPLLKILVFGELNLFVSENPFVKFPNALAVLTRPSSTATDAQLGGSTDGGTAPTARGGGRWSRGAQDVLSLANIISERRGSLLVGFPRNVSSNIDSRAGDVRRQQQRFHREDALAFSRLLQQHASVGGARAAGGSTAVGEKGGAGAHRAGSEDDAFFYGAYSDTSYYNPRTTRSEKRDYLSRKAMAALKDIHTAEESIYRTAGVEEAQDAMRHHRIVNGVHTLPLHLPTLPHYVALIRKDAHISYLLHTSSGSSGGSASAARRETAELEKLTHQLASALAKTAMQYHRQTARRINHQKVSVAAAVLDDFVETQLAARLASAPAEHATDGAHAQLNDHARMQRSLGVYKRFASRALDESGYFTDARVDDYSRWMATP